MANKYKRIDVYPADLQKLSGQSDSSAYREYNSIKEVLDLPKKAKLTIFHLRDVRKVPLEDIVDALDLWLDKGNDGKKPD